MATTDPFGTTSLTPQSATTAAASTMPWKSFDQYWTDKGQLDLAKKYGAYHSSYLPETGAGSTPGDWGPEGNPYRFSEEYNKYKTTLPQTYQDLMSAGISPEQVQSGQVNSILQNGKVVQIPTTPEAAAAGMGSYYGQGSGSSNSLSSDILQKMWR